MVNVTVEADAFCGPILAKRAAEAGRIYSLAFGDQPALICDLVDWARTCGFPVVAAGRGHKWLPHFCESTPETVWDNWGLTPEQAAVGAEPENVQQLLGWLQAAIESTAVSNAADSMFRAMVFCIHQPALPTFPSSRGPQRGRCAREEGDGRGDFIARDRRTRDSLRDPHGGVGHGRGRDRLHQELLRRVQGAHRPSGRYFTLYKRWHLIGLEVGQSVASVALRVSHRNSLRLAGRCRGHCQARPSPRRPSGW